MKAKALGAAWTFLAATACTAQSVLEAHGPPSNYAMSEPCVLLFDLQAVDVPVVVTGLTVASDADPGHRFHFELLIRDGTSLGGTATSGPGSSLQGWTSLGEVEGVQGPIYSAPSLPISLPRFVVRAGQLVGVALYAHYDWGIYFYSDPINPMYSYSNAHLRLTTGDGRDSNPFGLGQRRLPGCILVGSVYYDLDPCYPNCDSSTIAPVLNVNDFVCFLGKFANGDTYANCDGSTTPPVLNVNDFVCFATSLAQGCS